MSSKARDLSKFPNDIPYDNTTSGLTATDVQTAIDEVVDEQGTMSTQDANAVAITGGSIDATIAYDNNASGLTATNVQQAIDETNTRFASLSGRNRIINGGMDVWQRGTSITVGSEDTYTVDRWTAREGVVSQSTDVPANQGFKYSLFYDNDGTRTAINIRQKIEDGKVLLENIPVTLSFWAKGSINATISVDWTDTNTTNLSLTTSWQRFEVSFPATAINPNNIFSGSAWVDFNFGASYPDVRLTGVQLEVGSVATPFERRPYGTELALCQRYFEKSFNVEVAPANGVSTPDRRQGISYQSTRIGYQEQFKIPKRANPSMVLFRGSASSTDNQWGYFNGSGWVTMPTHGTNIRQNEFRIDFVVTGRAVGQAWILDGNWTASAEL